MCFKEVFLCFIHVNTDIWKSEVSCNGSAKDLLLNLALYFDFFKIVFESKFCYFNQMINRNLWESLFFWFFFSMLKVRLSLVCLNINGRYLPLLKGLLQDLFLFVLSVTSSEPWMCYDDLHCIRGRVVTYFEGSWSLDPKIPGPFNHMVL